MTPLRAAALLYVFLGVAFGAGSPPMLISLAISGELPMSPFGWRYMAGPFLRLGTQPFLTLGWTLVGICALDVLAGVWLWQRRPRGVGLGLATSVPMFVLGLGFGLPLLLLGVPIRTALVLGGRGDLR